MDLLIKGIGLPKGNMILIIDSAGCIRCEDTYTEKSEALNPFEFKAVELPPHGELIDRQESLKEMRKTMKCDLCPHRNDECSWCSLNEWQDVIRYAPTIVEASK